MPALRDQSFLWSCLDWVAVASGNRDIREEGTLDAAQDLRIGSIHFALWTNFVWHFHTIKENVSDILSHYL